MSAHVATVCRSCPAGRADLADALRAGFAATNLDVDLRETDCMSGCIRASALAFRAPGKTAYLFGEISTADLPEILTFARLYLESPDGNFGDARPLGLLRAKAIARIPG